MIEEINMSTYRPRMRMILGIGDSGTGKTHFIGTMPKPILVFSFDQGFDTIAMKDGIKVISIQEKDRKSPKAWTDFKTRFKQWEGGEMFTWADGRQEKYRSVALDGVGPFLSEYCLNHYQYLGSNIDKKATFTQYQQILENMGDVFNDCKRLAEYVVVTALTKIDKDELSGEIMTLPNLTGSIKDQLAAKFDAVFFFYLDRKPDGREVYAIKTVAGYREKGKIRLPSEIKSAVAPTVENPSFEGLLGMVDAKITSVYGNAPTPPAKDPIISHTLEQFKPPPQAPLAKPAGPLAPRPIEVAKPAAVVPITPVPVPTPIKAQTSVVAPTVKPGVPAPVARPVAAPAYVAPAKIQPRVR